jgi:hypothetical protein
MKKGFPSPLVSMLAAIALSLPFLGCASDTALTRESSDDCLILVNSIVDNPRGFPTPRKCYFVLNHNYPAVMVPSSKSGRVGIRISEGNTKVIAFTSSIGEAESIKANTTKDSMNISLPYKPGAVIAADFTIIQTLYSVGGDNTRYFTNYNFRNTTAEEKAELLKKFWASGTSKSWKD